MKFIGYNIYIKVIYYIVIIINLYFSFIYLIVSYIYYYLSWNISVNIISVIWVRIYIKYNVLYI